MKKIYIAPKLKETAIRSHQIICASLPINGNNAKDEHIKSADARRRNRFFDDDNDSDCDVSSIW